MENTNEVMENKKDDCCEIMNTNAENQNIEDQIDETVHIRPLTDISENEDAIIITSNIPGVEKENLDISVMENILTLSGEYIYEKEDCSQKQKVRRCYERQFKISADIDSTKIEATVKQGVVFITLPKTVKPEPRKIAIKVH